MKNLYTIIGFLAVGAGMFLTSCTKNTTINEPESKSITVSVTMPSEELGTKVSFAPETESHGDWAVTWNDGERLGAAVWTDGNYPLPAFTEFTMATKTDSKTATFTGTIPTGDVSFRFVYPYDATANIINQTNGYYPLDFRTQSIDLAKPYESLRANTYLLGEFLMASNINDAVTLNHICTYVKVRLKFSNLPANATLLKAELSSTQLNSYAQLDLNASSDMAINDPVNGVITLSVRNSSGASLVDGTEYVLPMATVPTSFTSETSIQLTVYLSVDGVIKKSTSPFSIAPSSPVTFARGTYNYLSFSCDMTNTTDVTEYWSSSAASEFAGGDGSAESPYLITEPQHLAHLASLVNNGANQTGVYFKVSNDIDLSGKKWTSIGNASNIFAGTFDGGHHTISGLYYHEVNGYAGLFGNTNSSSAYIKNTNVEGYIYATGKSSGDHTNVGGISGYNSGTVINCSFSGSVTSYSNTGGIVGYGAASSSKVINCYNEGCVYSSGTSNQAAGGVFGFGSGSIINCYSIGSVSVGTGSGTYGGVAGGGTVSNSYYLNTCGAAGNGISMTAEAMKSADFVTTLNTKVASLRSTYPDIVTWKTTPGSTYPTFSTRY